LVGFVPRTPSKKPVLSRYYFCFHDLFPGRPDRRQVDHSRRRTTDQLETNLRAAGLQLPPSETAALDAASDPHPADYPYGEQEDGHQSSGPCRTASELSHC
jgi:hypothetical protein